MSKFKNVIQKQKKLSEMLTSDGEGTDSESGFAPDYQIGEEKTDIKNKISPNVKKGEFSPTDDIVIEDVEKNKIDNNIVGSEKSPDDDLQLESDEVSDLGKNGCAMEEDDELMEDDLMDIKAMDGDGDNNCAIGKA